MDIRARNRVSAMEAREYGKRDGSKGICSWKSGNLVSAIEASEYMVSAIENKLEKLKTNWKKRNRRPARLYWNTNPGGMGLRSPRSRILYVTQK